MTPEFSFPNEILLATSNAKKIREMERMVGPLGIRLLRLTDVPSLSDVDETGKTFMENAEIKASAQAKHAGIWAIGEDSGLCVEALGGAPGIYSARFSGVGATDEKNNDLLLEKLTGFEPSARKAFYVSTIALCNPKGEIVVRASGECHGRILDQRRGHGGFGYDPLFEVLEYHQTFAELGLAVKSAISHRGRSMRDFIKQLLLHKGQTH